jgi:hypothetical protein
MCATVRTQGWFKLHDNSSKAMLTIAFHSRFSTCAAPTKPYCRAPSFRSASRIGHDNTALMPILRLERNCRPELTLHATTITFHVFHDVVSHLFVCRLIQAVTPVGEQTGCTKFVAQPSQSQDGRRCAAVDASARHPPRQGHNDRQRYFTKKVKHLERSSHA